MSLTDSRRMWVLLRDAGEDGCHSHDLRASGVSGNPSQRAKDIVTYGQSVWTAREARNGRPGSRYWLRDFAPNWAVPVKPNETSGRGGDAVLAPKNLAGDAVESVPSPPPPAPPVAPVLGWYRDYTRADSEWELREAA